MSFFLGKALRRFFPLPKPIETAPPQTPASTENGMADDMDSHADINLEALELGALSQAVDLHESVNEMERSTHEARLRNAMEDLFKRLDKKHYG